MRDKHQITHSTSFAETELLGGGDSVLSGGGPCSIPRDASGARLLLVRVPVGHYLPVPFVSCASPPVATIISRPSDLLTGGAMAAPLAMEERIRGHSSFFDRLVELIPARHYVPDEKDPERSKFNKTKSAKALAKLEAKENSKKALRAKLQPNGMTTLEKIKRKAKGSDDNDDDASDSENSSDFEDDVSDEELDEESDHLLSPKEKPSAPNTPAGAPPTTSGWSVGESGGDRLGELRERLAQKIAASRVARKAEEDQEKIVKAKEWREEKKKTKTEKKKKEKAEERKKGKGKDDDVNASKKRKNDASDSEDADDDSNLQFSRVEVEGKITGHSKKKRASKEQLLKKALSQRREIEDAGGEDTVEGKKVAERYSWDAALARAGGEKVLDDPKLLQKSVKNELRQKKKSQEKWQERNNRTTEQMAAKQKKRKDSLKGRADAKVEKRIEKREKKRNRPGFEGRSQAPINK
tara:strand:+ start:4200 stop:5600 length:1401 start_codon:yes stop_codon:yes gene_type:complete